MNLKKTLAVFLSAVIVACSFAACSAKETEKKVADTTAVTQTTTEAVTVQVEDKEEIVSFTAKDRAENTLTLVPIFDKDAVTVIAGYITGVTDKSKKALTAKEYKLLNSVVSASGTGKKITLDFNKDKSLIAVETYSDAKGNFNAIKDIKDLNKNKNKEEFLRLVKVKDNHGIEHYVVKYEVVKIEKDKKGNTVIKTKDGKTESAKKVDSKNKEAKEKVNETKDKNEDTSKKNKTTNNANSEKPTGGSETPTDPTQNDEQNGNKIVLKKNRQASSSADGVKTETGLVEITAAGDYTITSETDVWHGQIVLRLPNTESAELRFEDVTIENDSKNIIQIIDTSIDIDRGFLEQEASADSTADDYIEAISENDSAPDVSLSFPTGTKSKFTTAANGNTGVIYNESKLTIKGNGAVSVNAERNSNNCICSTKSITIKNVDLSLSTAAHDVTSSTRIGSKGIYSYNKVNVESGRLTVRSNGDSVRCSRFNLYDGTVDIKSSACDGIDADNSIVISGGRISAIALQKSSFKVRRVNNTEKGVKDGIRDGKGDTFEINGGTVTGESKKVSTVQSGSKQPNITARIVKKNAGTADAANESKTPAVIMINSLNQKTDNKCTKFLYSSSSVKKGTQYTATANGVSAKVNWSGNVGSARIVSSTGR